MTSEENSSETLVQFSEDTSHGQSANSSDIEKELDRFYRIIQNERRHVSRMEADTDGLQQAAVGNYVSYMDKYGMNTLSKIRTRRQAPGVPLSKYTVDGQVRTPVRLEDCKCNKCNTSKLAYNRGDRVETLTGLVFPPKRTLLQMQGLGMCRSGRPPPLPAPPRWS
ncbi:uncharacterized protein LOC143277771 [Babylonia areolata]|uniref:uncharacterized protein LOC143277771 n=1 Tax=Babylonia areolata TaxID=304850 RepID=UPI003FD02BA1